MKLIELLNPMPMSSGIVSGIYRLHTYGPLEADDSVRSLMRLEDASGIAWMRLSQDAVKNHLRFRPDTVEVMWHRSFKNGKADVVARLVDAAHFDAPRNGPGLLPAYKASPDLQQALRWLVEFGTKLETRAQRQYLNGLMVDRRLVNHLMSSRGETKAYDRSGGFLLQTVLSMQEAEARARRLFPHDHQCALQWQFAALAGRMNRLDRLSGGVVHDAVEWHLNKFKASDPRTGLVIDTTLLQPA